MGSNLIGSLVRGFIEQAKSLQAVVIRDMMLRYGRNNLGFLWIIVEPMLLTTGVLVVFSQIKSGGDKGMQIVPMLLSGYMPLTMWRHTTNAGVNLVRRISNLLYHRNISVFDAYFGRMLMEGLGTTGALVMIYGALLALDLVPMVADFGILFSAWFLLWWYGSAAALIIAGLTEYNETWEKFIPPYQYLMIPISGVFFLIDWLPRSAQDLIAWNPMTNCIEFFRAGFFGEEVPTYYSPKYVVIVCLVLTWFGLWLLEVSRARFNGR